MTIHADILHNGVPLPTPNNCRAVITVIFFRVKNMSELPMKYKDLRDSIKELEQPIAPLPFPIGAYILLNLAAMFV